jgi:tight adherence protein B
MQNVALRDLWYAGVLAVVLVAVILLIMAIYHYFIEPARKRQKVNRRLSEGHHERLQRIQILKERSENPKDWWTKLVKFIVGEKRLAKLKTHMLQADIHQDPGAFLRICLYPFAIGFLIGFFFMNNAVLGLFLGGALGITPFLFIKWKRRNKTLKFEAQMPDAMELLARSLRAGHTLPSALEVIGNEMEDPMAAEMGIAYEEQKYGISVADALVHTLERVDSMDLNYFVAAVLIQQETGGNLAELMENIARVIRSRLNFKAKVRGLTAMGRLSSIIMVIVPVVIFFLLMAVAHKYEKVLVETSTGRTMLMAGVVSLLIGGYLLKKLINSVEV